MLVALSNKELWSKDKVAFLEFLPFYYFVNQSGEYDGISPHWKMCSMLLCGRKGQSHYAPILIQGP